MKNLGNASIISIIIAIIEFGIAFYFRDEFGFLSMNLWSIAAIAIITVGSATVLVSFTSNVSFIVAAIVTWVAFSAILAVGAIFADTTAVSGIASVIDIIIVPILIIVDIVLVYISPIVINVRKESTAFSITAPDIGRRRIYILFLLEFLLTATFAAVIIKTWW